MMSFLFFLVLENRGRVLWRCLQYTQLDESDVGIRRIRCRNWCCSTCAVKTKMMRAVRRRKSLPRRRQREAELLNRCGKVPMCFRAYFKNFIRRSESNVTWGNERKEERTRSERTKQTRANVTNETYPGIECTGVQRKDEQETRNSFFLFPLCASACGRESVWCVHSIPLHALSRHVSRQA